MLVTYLKQERAANKRYSLRLIVTRDNIKHVQLNVSKTNMQHFVFIDTAEQSQILRRS